MSDSPVRFSFLAVDLESGEEVWWSTRTDRTTAQHIQAGDPTATASAAGGA